MKASRGAAARPLWAAIGSVRPPARAHRPLVASLATVARPGTQAEGLPAARGGGGTLGPRRLRDRVGGVGEDARRVACGPALGRRHPLHLAPHVATTAFDHVATTAAAQANDDEEAELAHGDGEPPVVPDEVEAGAVDGGGW